MKANIKFPDLADRIIGKLQAIDKERRYTYFAYYLDTPEAVEALASVLEEIYDETTVAEKEKKKSGNFEVLLIRYGDWHEVDTIIEHFYNLSSEDAIENAKELLIHPSWCKDEIAIEIVEK